MHYSSFGVTENFPSNFGINIKIWGLVIIIRILLLPASCFFNPLSAKFNRNNLVVSDN